MADQTAARFRQPSHYGTLGLLCFAVARIEGIYSPLGWVLGAASLFWLYISYSHLDRGKVAEEGDLHHG
jgi:hypothetical protein